MNRRPHSDGGFTLIEMMIAIALVALVGTVLGAALILGFRTTNDTYTKLGQAQSEQAITRFLSGDVYAAQGVVANNATTTLCGVVAPLKLQSRSSMSSSTLDTTVVWYLSGTDLIRRTCVNNTLTDSYTVAGGISSFTVTACAAPCTSRTVQVAFTAKGTGTKAPDLSWSLTLQRRGATS